MSEQQPPPLAPEPHHSAVILFYKYFVPSENCLLFQNYKTFYVDRLLQHQVDLCTRLGLKGRILLSTEGINGTLSGIDSTSLQEYRHVLDHFDLIRDVGVVLSEEEQEQCHNNKNNINLDRLVENLNPFLGIDWKESFVDDNSIQPFPDLKVTIVDEIVSTGGLIKVEDISKFGGYHLTPEEFHNVLSSADCHPGAGGHGGKEIVLVDVRNTFEYDIGHFIHPQSPQQHALNPNMVTFSTFDSNFCSKYANHLQDKMVLMYCTGGIRCEKASAMLRKRGVHDVYQLKGGIHRYLEKYGNDGFFHGRNFVFDQRVALTPIQQQQQQKELRDVDDDDNATRDDKDQTNTFIVGSCVECGTAFDELCGSRICTVCRDLVLVCPICQISLREYHCRRHAKWKHCYFTFLDPYTEKELMIQKIELERLHKAMLSPFYSKNVRRTLTRQIIKIEHRLDQLVSKQVVPNPNASRRCRTCSESSNVCDGRCWGFWNFKKQQQTFSLDNGSPCQTLYLPFL